MKELPEEIASAIGTSFPEARELTLTRTTASFLHRKEKREFAVKIYIEDAGDWCALLTHMDSAYEQEIMWRTENSFQDLFHEIRIYTDQFSS